MKTPTFKEQLDKIEYAYNHDLINPLADCGCFIGTLLNRNSGWSHTRDFVKLEKIDPNHSSYEYGEECIIRESQGLYSVDEIISMERNFILECYKGKHVFACADLDENDLFLAIDSTLKMLRTIHESKGETVEDYTFTKRQRA